ncbi:adenylate/guanylate cyclase domain-containing protein [Chitinophaga barathri]|uniref:Adenylate/guanylate cyclase domain-containing protein n=1 Tax=Chitinophaga barathri TaxID=1647451 RepID=A0A3N4MI71_9BACT|nr:adenylate/guanylate cyclase domain-containing protein [Chitinophaga barathri]RPD41487.1 adenylate/guanylate cyclase domain-containing protein [Chitinophaga barathri]
MLSPKTKRNISGIIPFGIIWLLFSIVYSLLERGLLGPQLYYPSTGNPYNFTRNLLVTPVFALFTGLLVGAIEILYLKKFFIQRSFSEKIVYKSVIYLAAIVLFLIILTVNANSFESRAGIFGKDVWNNTRAFFFDYAFLSVSLYMASVILVSQFYAEVSENIGQVVLINLLKGKYHTPKEEERIYMFLDIRSSTSIAERLGHIRYFEMLKEFYADLSDAIIEHSGEIYQYVGDEIVVSWTPGNGLKNNNCIRCFFAIKAAIGKQAEKYRGRFGMLPEFKAGFHQGKVTTGEIGIVKKEIIFTGDVLNTASRIQGLCNTHNVDLLVSGALVAKLETGNGFHIRSLGETGLKGRGEKITLFTVLMNEQ